jgi:hypothetical protein
VLVAVGRAVSPEAARGFVGLPGDDLHPRGFVTAEPDLGVTVTVDGEFPTDVALVVDDDTPGHLSREEPQAISFVGFERTHERGDVRDGVRGRLVDDHAGGRHGPTLTARGGHVHGINGPSP